MRLETARWDELCLSEDPLGHSTSQEGLWGQRLAIRTVGTPPLVLQRVWRRETALMKES